MAGRDVARVINRCDQAKEDKRLKLHFNNNHLSSLPDELRQMEGLTLLDISHNHFTVFPSVIYKVDSLKILNAQSNSIKEVDVQRLKHMPSMSELNLQDNPLHLDIHSQLIGLSEDITVLVTPQDPELDAVD